MRLILTNLIIFGSLLLGLLGLWLLIIGFIRLIAVLV